MHSQESRIADDKDVRRSRGRSRSASNIGGFFLKPEDIRRVLNDDVMESYQRLDAGDAEGGMVPLDVITAAFEVGYFQKMKVRS